MYPVLFSIGSFQLHTYGLMIAIGFLVAVAVIKRLAIRSRLPVDPILDLTFWGLMVGFLGARIVFVITRWSFFVEDPISIFKVWEGGLVFFGGPLAVVPFAIGFMKKKKLPAWKTADILVPGLSIAHVFGRFGCVAAGCCYGKPTGTDYGIRLHSDLVEVALRGIPLHPVQLYEAGAVFILFLGLLYVYQKRAFDGQVVLTYFMAYPVIRSIVEIYRGDTIRGFVIEDVLSTSQFISILIFLGALGFLLYRLQQLKKKEP